ncbi:MAG: hypothetical protein JSV91_04790 [Phycisphaerales bacterium]|nr:MAG: hypothetical protein JSV91_04790 [Phycisphaerales bacterium]
MKSTLITVMSVAIVSGAAVAQPVAGPEADALDEALALVGMARADLGWRAKGYRSGYPADIPYKLRQFDDLLAEPIANVSYLRTMANCARLSLDAEALDEQPARASAGSLYQAVCRLGIMRKSGQFRSYSCNLTAEPTSLFDAVLKCYDYARRPTKFITFGTESPYPLVEQDLTAAVEAVPEEVQPIIGKLILNVLDAHYWADLAWRNVSMEHRMTVAQRLDTGQEQVDALDYCPAFDDVARTWDESSLWYAGSKCVEALDQARKELKNLAAQAGPFAFDWKTPLGWIRVHGTGNDVYDGDNTLLIVDLGGNDEYRGSVAGSGPTQPISLLLDMSGDDRYAADSVAQGAGVCGVGILLDVAGHDTYQAGEYGQGVGQFGLGACIDLAGDDTYFTKYSGQGCGYFGVGLQLDAAGNDQYLLWADGQGLGGVSGVGVLADRSGDDRYEAVRDALITGRPSYHSAQTISVSNAQGCAMGRRGDGADGHSWAGGLGALIDIEGTDYYTSGNWSQGTGYWFGMGYLYDGSGDDEYHGVVWSQATGAHFCIGVLLDEGGDDKHLAEESSVNSIAFGHDFTVALLVNLGGNDFYELEQSGLGCSINRSVAMLIDSAGDDTYRESPRSRPGMSIYDGSRFGNWDDYTTYFADSTSIGLFLDVGGTDRYEPCHPSAERHKLHPLPEELPEPPDPNDPEAIRGTIAACGNNMIWLDPNDSPNWRVRNFSVGVDRESGTIDFRPIPEKPPSRRDGG